MCVQIIQLFVSKVGVFDSFFAIFLRKLHQFWPIFHISIDSNILYTFVKTPCPKKNPVTHFQVILSPNQLFLAVFAIFSRTHHQFWLIFNISIDWNILYSFCSDTMSQKNLVTLFLAILCPNYAFFVLFWNRVILRRVDLYGLSFISK